MRVQTQKQLLARFAAIEQRLRRAARKGKGFAEIRQALGEVHGLVDAELPAGERASFDTVLDGTLQALAVLPPAPAPDVARETATLLGDLVHHLVDTTRRAQTRQVVVFLPYKASMWDSLESIWRAAAEDAEHCQAIVMPIPYADRNPDGSAAEWHYEIDAFPKDVPVVRFDAVDLAALHPDVIFIHNPYDDCNRVTSVAPQFYSRFLKDMTDNLVYVPYFVSDKTVDPELCKAPGIVNADHVIVQDENIKEQYEKNYPAGKPPKGKFLALGSPKFDKVRSARREDYVLPPEWQRLVEGKKTVLYNTTIAGVLHFSDIFCAKLRQVFETFRARDDVVLWWRPHPLLAATLASMRPELHEAYQKLVREYRDEGWGIYDDTPDLHRAIACTDAYYGDGGSLLPLYEATGKAVMVQNYNTAKPEEPEEKAEESS